MAKVTNKDIARRAGVSQAAVSMAIHGKRGISEATRAHILRIVQEMNYEPPARTRLPAAGAAVLVAATPAERMLPLILQSLLNYTQQQDAELKIFTLSQILENTEEKLGGCSLLVTFGEAERTALDLFASLVPRVLVIDGNYFRKPFLNIRIDYAGAAYTLTAHLRELGHRSFLYLNEDLPAGKNLICFSGFQRLVLEQHLPLNPDQIIMDAGADPNVWSHFPDILQNNNISAVVCTSDAAAVHAADQLAALGLRIPEDVSVAAIVSQDSAVHPGFSFTRISLNQDRIGEEVFRIISQQQHPYKSADLVIPAGPLRRGQSAGAPKYNPAEKKLAIAMYLKDHPTMRVARAGFLNNVQQMGYQAEVVGTPNGDDASFTEVVKTLLNMDVDGVAMWLAVPEAIRLVAGAGIPVVCLHAIAEEPERLGVRSNITEDPLAVAREVSAFFARQLQGRSGSIALTQSGDNLLETGITREFRRLMREACPQITVLDDLPFVHHTAANIRRVTDLITNTPDLVGAFITAGDACAAWAAAKKALGKTDLIIVGTDYTDEALTLLENGEIQAFVAQPIYEETQTSVVALDAILRGKDFPAVCRLEAPLVTKETAEKYSRLLQEVRNWYV